MISRIRRCALAGILHYCDCRREDDCAQELSNSGNSERTIVTHLKVTIALATDGEASAARSQTGYT